MGKETILPLREGGAKRRKGDIVLRHPSTAFGGPPPLKGRI
jgi:hypothetical protein